MMHGLTNFKPDFVLTGFTFGPFTKLLTIPQTSDHYDSSSTGTGEMIREPLNGVLLKFGMTS